MPDCSRALFEHLPPTFALHLTERKKGGSIYCTTLALIQDFKWVGAGMANGRRGNLVKNTSNMIITEQECIMPFATSCDLVHEPIRNAHTLKT